MNKINELEQAAQNFKQKTEKKKEYASQIVALQILCNLDILNPKTLSQESYTSIIKRIEKALRAERIKALQKHWSYDVNRHIALKKIRDQFTSKNISLKP